MAKIKLTDVISDIRGRVGTHIFSIWKGTHTVRMEPKNFQYPWVSQFNWLHRRLVDEVAYSWDYDLTLWQRDLWDLMAEYLGTLIGLYAEGGVERIPGLRRYGGAMSGFNAFNLINDLRWAVGKTNILELAPLFDIWPPQPIFTSLEATYTTKWKFKATYQDPGALPRPTYVRAWCRGKRFAHLLIAKYLVIGAPFELEWETMHYAKGHVFDLLNDTYQVQLDFITENGLFSPPSEIKTMRLLGAFPGGIWDEYVWNAYAWG